MWISKSRLLMSVNRRTGIFRTLVLSTAAYALIHSAQSQRAVHRHGKAIFLPNYW